MKKSLKLLLILLCLAPICLLALLACPPCDTDKCDKQNCVCIECECVDCNKEREFVFATASFLYTEPHSDISKIMVSQRTQTDNAVYFFNEITPQNRILFADLTEDLLDLLSMGDFLYADLTLNRLSVFVSDRFYTRANSATRSLFINPSDFKTYKFINFTLQALLCQTANYGLLHGLSVRIFESLGWNETANAAINNGKTFKTSDQIALFLQDESNRHVLDLTFGVFNQRFSSLVQIEYAYAISVGLIDHIIATNTDFHLIFTQLLNHATNFDLTFSDQFYPLLNKYLHSISVQKIKIPDQIFRFASYTFDFPVLFKTYSSDYFLHRDWEGERHIQLHYPFTFGDFELTYLTFRDFLLEREPAFERIRDFFGWTDFERSVAKMMDYILDLGHMGQIYWDTSIIVLASLAATTHEYAHFVKMKHLGFIYSWTIEALAVYADAVFDDLNTDNLYAAFYYDFDPSLFGPIFLETIELYRKLFELCRGAFTSEKFVTVMAYVALIEHGRPFDLYNTSIQFVFVVYAIENFGVDAVFNSHKNWGSLGFFGDLDKVEDNFKQWLIDFVDE